jgi:hypothetical protein
MVARWTPILAAPTPRVETGGDMLKRWTCLTIVVLATSLVAACASQKVPAEAAVKAAEQAFAAVKVEAVKYVPDQVKGVQDTLETAKASLAKGDYMAALTAAQGLPAQIGQLQTAVAAKKAELMQTWATLNAGLPQVFQAIQSRVDILSKAKKLPAGLDAAKLNSAKSGLAEITQAWGVATAAASAGNVADAVSKAKAVKGQAVEVLTTLGMPIPSGLQ